MNINKNKGLLGHFVVITLLNVYFLDTFMFLERNDDMWGIIRLMIWIVLAFCEQIILWRSNFFYNSGGNWNFRFKILNPIVWGICLFCLWVAVWA